MTIDERLEFLLHSTESLHASCQELHAIIEAQAAKEERLRQALLQGIRAFLEGLAGTSPEEQQ